MKNVLIIGATGFIGAEVRRLLLEESDHQITLFARHADRINNLNDKREQIIVGDILKKEELAKAIKGQDVVVWAAAGAVDRLTQPVIKAMTEHKINRLIHMNAMGIYNEVPASVGLQYNLDNWPAIRASRRGADMVKESPLNYTIIRGAWFDDSGDDYY